MIACSSLFANLNYTGSNGRAQVVICWVAPRACQFKLNCDASGHVWISVGMVSKVYFRVKSVWVMFGYPLKVCLMVKFCLETKFWRRNT